MDKEQQRIKIAEACGWRHIFLENGMLWGKEPVDGISCEVPHYLNDPNAMHEAEKVLNVETFEGVYAPTLETIVRADRDALSKWWTCHATAAQRADAFLQTLNLCEDKTMIQQQQRIKIAEACGWKRCPIPEPHLSQMYGGDWWRNADEGTVACLNDLPDYLNDLNAMHEAEKVLTHDQQIQYSVELGKLTTAYLPSSRAAWMDFTIANASAAQRARAFLEALGLWEDKQ